MKTSKLNAQDTINNNTGHDVLRISGTKNYGVLINKETDLVAADNIDLSSFDDDETSVERIDTDDAASLYADKTGKPVADYSSYEYVKITLTAGDSVAQYVLPILGW